jgi:hypothetical protein
VLSGHCAEVHSIGVFTLQSLAVPLIISEAILHTNDNPERVSLATLRPATAYHRLVKTTPKPNATKKSSGELGPFPLPSTDGEGEVTAEVAEGTPEVLEVAILVDGRVGDLDIGC